MKLSICHYSLHRTWAKYSWDCRQLAQYVKSLGVEGVDFHTGYLGEANDASEKIMEALDISGLKLSGLSLSTEFC